MMRVVPHGVKIGAGLLACCLPGCVADSGSVRAVSAGAVRKQPDSVVVRTVDGGKQLLLSVSRRSEIRKEVAGPGNPPRSRAPGGEYQVTSCSLRLTPRGGRSGELVWSRAEAVPESWAGLAPLRFLDAVVSGDNGLVLYACTHVEVDVLRRERGKGWVVVESIKLYRESDAFRTSARRGTISMDRYARLWLANGHVQEWSLAEKPPKPIRGKAPKTIGKPGAASISK